MQTILCWTKHRASTPPLPKVGDVYAAHYDRRDDHYALTNGFGVMFGTQSVVLIFIKEITNGMAYSISQSVNIDELQHRDFRNSGNGYSEGPSSNYMDYYVKLPRQ